MLFIAKPELWTGWIGILITRGQRSSLVFFFFFEFSLFFRLQNSLPHCPYTGWNAKNIYLPIVAIDCLRTTCHMPVANQLCTWPTMSAEIATSKSLQILSTLYWTNWTSRSSIQGDHSLCKHELWEVLVHSSWANRTLLKSHSMRHTCTGESS